MPIQQKRSTSRVLRTSDARLKRRQKSRESSRRIQPLRLHSTRCWCHHLTWKLPTRDHGWNSCRSNRGREPDPLETRIDDTGRRSEIRRSDGAGWSSGGVLNFVPGSGQKLVTTSSITRKHVSSASRDHVMSVFASTSGHRN